MKLDSSWLSVPVAVGVVALATYMMWPKDPPPSGPIAGPGDGFAGSPWPTRPDRPPVPGRDVPSHQPMPEMPPPDRAALSQVYRDAVQAGDPYPGDAAFRATIDAFIEHNRKFAEAQARDEKLTLDEVRELTYFGFLVLQTQRWPVVEDLIGRELDGDERAAGEELMHETNAGFKRAMRELVASDAPPEERWALIQSTQMRYRQAYFALTGMNAELLDDLLAGDIGRDYAPAATQPPAYVPPSTEDVAPPGPRPADTPR